LLTQGTRVYTWDAANRLVGANVNGVASSFEYDGLSNRTSQAVDGVTTEYVLDVAGGLPEVIVATTGGASTQYVQVQGQILAQYESGAWAYVLPDHLGSVRQLAADGQVALAQSYDPFGGLLETAGPGQSEFAYTGEQMDTSVGLVFLRARYYDSTTGRFVSKDPLPGYVHVPQSQHPYIYAWNNPIRLTDPNGQQVSGDARSIIRRIVQEDTNGGLDALIRLFETDELDNYDPPAGNTAQARLELVLEATLSAAFAKKAGLDLGIHFDIDFTTCELRGEFNDEWLYTKYWNQNPDDPNVANQVGHFLTAVRLGYDPAFLDNPATRLALHTLIFRSGSAAPITVVIPPSWDWAEDVDTMAKRLIVGHEKVADPEPSILFVGDLAQTATNIPFQYQSADRVDVLLFDEAVQADRSGDSIIRDTKLRAILTSPNPEDWGSGNSLEDLKLSVKGWRLGRAVAGKDQDLGERTLTTRQEIGNWIKVNISLPYLPMILKK
jgi:RHS repeat-associated protein